MLQYINRKYDFFYGLCKAKDKIKQSKNVFKLIINKYSGIKNTFCEWKLHYKFLCH